MHGPFHRLLILASLSCLTSCSAFKINVGTPEPIKMDPIDITVKMDIYQHRDDKPTDPKQAEADEKAARVRIYNRQAEIQKRKNERILIETHKGILRIREIPADPNYQTFLKKIVEEENFDRTIIMRNDAEERGVDLYEIEKERFKENVAKSFKDEWIEVEDPKKPGKFIDTQKP